MPKTTGWHPAQTEDDIDLLKWEVDNCKRRITELKKMLSDAGEFLAAGHHSGDPFCPPCRLVQEIEKQAAK